MKESDLVVKTMKAIRGHGGWWVKIHGHPTQESGIPDIIGCYRGYFVAIEMKLPEAVDVSPRQRLQLERIRRARGVSVVCTTTKEALAVLEMIETWASEDNPKPLPPLPK